MDALGNHGRSRPTRATRKEQRQMKREIRFMRAKAQGGGEREKARRVSQMVHEQLKADNGVEQQFEEAQSSASEEADDAEGA